MSVTQRGARPRDASERGAPRFMVGALAWGCTRERLEQRVRARLVLAQAGGEGLVQHLHRVVAAGGRVRWHAGAAVGRRLAPRLARVAIRWQDEPRVAARVAHAHERRAGR